MCCLGSVLILVFNVAKVTSIKVFMKWNPLAGDASLDYHMHFFQ